jgi:hypothetical protein
MNDRQRKLLGKVLIAIAVVSIMLSAPCLLGGVLALSGVLADVGPAENQQMGQKLFLYAAYPLGFGLLALVAGLLVRRSRPK